MVVNSFKPSGLYRFFAYFVGLTKFKSVEFLDESFQLHSNRRTISINYTDVNVSALLRSSK